MRMLAFVFAVMLLAAGPAPSPAPIDPAAIDTVSIDITIGALGPGAAFHAVYRRHGAGELVSQTGATISQTDLASFVSVLNGPLQAAFDLSRSAIQPPLLAKYIDFLEQGFLGPHRADPKIDAAFRKTYLDYPLLQQRCGKAMRMQLFMTDYYPHLKLVASSNDRTLVSIVGSSQREFFVPVFVTRNGVEEKTSDPLLTDWIAALLPKGAPLQAVMYGNDVLFNWAHYAANTHEVQMLIDGKDSTPPKFRSLFFENPCGIGHPYLAYPVSSASSSPAPSPSP